MRRRTAQRARTGMRPVPDLTESRLRLFGVALICAKVVLVPLLFDPTSDVPFVVIKGVVSHGLAYALAGVVLGLAIRSGLPVFGRSWLHVLVLGFLAASVAATLFAPDGLVATYGEHGRM